MDTLIDEQNKALAHEIQHHLNLKRDFGTSQYIEKTKCSIVYENRPGNESVRSGFGNSMLKIGAQASVSDYISFMGT